MPTTCEAQALQNECWFCHPVLKNYPQCCWRRPTRCCSQLQTNSIAAQLLTVLDRGYGLSMGIGSSPGRAIDISYADSLPKNRTPPAILHYLLWRTASRLPECCVTQSVCFAAHVTHHDEPSAMLKACQFDPLCCSPASICPWQGSSGLREVCDQSLLPPCYF